MHIMIIDRYEYTYVKPRIALCKSLPFEL